MLDNLLSSIVQDVAIEGAKGCGLDKLWSFIEKSGQSYISQTADEECTLQCFKLDEKYKSFLWPYISKLNGLLFALDHTPSTLLNVESDSYSKVIEDYGSSFRIKTTLEIRKKFLFDGIQLGSPEPTGIRYDFLETIAAGREHGVSQNRLSELFNMDSRMVFHHVKTLTVNGLIEKTPASQGGTFTNICFHTRFLSKDKALKATTPSNKSAPTTKGSAVPVAPDGTIQRDEIYKLLIKALQEAKDHTVALSDLTTILGFKTERHVRWGRGFITSLQTKGVVEKIKVHSSEGRMVCVRLIKPESAQGQVQEPSEPTPTPTSTPAPTSTSTVSVSKDFYHKPLQDSGVWADVPLEYLVYKHIQDSEERGMTRNDLGSVIPTISTYHLKKVLANMGTFLSSGPPQYRIYAAKVILGKSHCFRYFGQTGWYKYMASIDQALPEKEEDHHVEYEDLVEPKTIFKHIFKAKNSRKKTAAKLKSPAKKKAPVKNMSVKKVVVKKVDAKDEMELDSHIPSDKPTNPSPPPPPPPPTPPTPPTQPTQQPTRITRSRSTTETPRNILDYFSVDRGTKTKPGSQTSQISPGQPDTPSKQSTLSPTSLPGPAKENIVENDPEIENRTLQMGLRPKRKIIQLETEQSEKDDPSYEPQDTPKTRRKRKCINDAEKETAVQSLQSSKKSNKRSIAALIKEDDQNTLPQSTLTIDREKVDSASPDPRPSKRTCKPVRNLTTENRKRKALDYILENKVCEVQKDIMDYINEGDDNHTLSKGIVRKTLTRILNLLSETGQVRKVTVAVADVKGGVEPRTFYLHPDVSEKDQVFKDYLQRTRIRKTVEAMSRNIRPVKIVKSEVERLKPIDRAYLNPKIIYRAQAQVYGWLVSKWLRAKEFHLHLYKVLSQQDDRADRIVNVDKTVESLPVRLFCSSIGVFIAVNEVPALCDQDATMDKIDPEIRKAMIRTERRLRKAISIFIQILEKLGTIKAIPNPTRYYPDVQLLEKGSVRNYTISTEPIIREESLETAQDAKVYWEELQYACTKFYYTHTLNMPEKKDGDNILFSIILPSTWKSDTIMSVTNERFLRENAEAVKRAGLDSEECQQLFKHIVRVTGLPSRRVRRYYDAMAENQENRKERLQQSKKALREKAISASIKSLINISQKGEKVAAVTQNGKSIYHGYEPTFVASRSFIKHRINSKVGEHHEEPEIRIPWTKVEKDAVFYSYIIMKQRCRGKIHSWRPISKVLPQRNPEKCRSLASRMVRRNGQGERRAAEYQEIWARIYEQGIKNGDIEDPWPFDFVNYDLNRYLEYFLMNLSHTLESSRKKNIYQLPKDTSLLAKELNWTRKPLVISPKIPRDITCTLYANSEQHQDDIGKSETVHDNIISYLSIIIKRILVTPTKSYSMSLVYSLLHEMSKEDIDLAIKRLHTYNVVSFAKNGQCRRIPGYILNVSERFLKVFSGNLPFRMMQEAESYDKQIVREEQLSDNDISPGKMACILSMFSAKKLNVELANRDDLIRKKMLLCYPKKYYPDLCVHWVNDGTEVVVSKSSSLHESTDVSNGLVTLDNQRVDTTTPDDPLVKLVYEAIKSQGENGIKRADLKKQTLISDQNIDRSIGHLTTCDPPLVVEVGYGSVRFVLKEFASQWQLGKTRGESTIRMWKDISGGTVHVAFKGSIEAVLGEILKHPGITLAGLQKKFEKLLEICELRDLLESMLRDNLIRKRVLQRHGRTSLFSSTVQFKLDKNGVTGGDNTTCYWTQDGYYNTSGRPVNT
ncbi:hypothetical protein CLU79DRAFT_848209 [Phycomyces nitens]|nr:hypothetical protein CLU79DRAFT_848209 [Phycomyces nitens]